MLDELVKLAQETSSEKRRDLLRSLSDHFLDDVSAITDRSTALFGSVVEDLLDQIPLEDRSDYASHTAENANMPHSIIMKMAQDDIAVASHVLEKSPLLDSADLIQIARTKGQEHLYAIAGRSSIDEDVTNVLIEKGETDVLCRVSGNEGAHISQKGFSTLADKANHDERLGESLSSRQSLPVNIAQQLMHVVSPQAREKLSLYIQKNGTAVAVELAQRAQQSLPEAKRKDRAQRIDAKVMIQRVKMGEASLSDVISELAGQDRLFDIAMILATFANLDEKALIRVLCDSRDEPVAVVCKVAALSAQAIEKLDTMRGKRLRRSAKNSQGLPKLVQKIDETDAERVLRFVRLRGSIKTEQQKSA
jgi:uncharacterized protein (DUF2336 family)